MLFASEGERALWEAVDRAVFSSEDPRAAFLESTRNLELKGQCGQLLKSLRRRAQKTPTEAATEAGVEPGRWRGWEANAALMSSAELARVCRVLGVDGSQRRQLLKEHRRAPVAYFERVFRGWERSSRRVARSTESPSSAEAVETTVLEQLDPAARHALSTWFSLRCGKPAGEEDLAAALRAAKGMSTDERRRWVEEVVEHLEDEQS